jgi:hypothetical protein
MRSHPSKSRVWFVIALVLVVAGVVAYFVGGMQARMEASQRIAATEAQLQTARSDNASMRSVDLLLRASNAVYRGSVTLAKGNFGTANARLAEAVADLKGVDPAAAGVDAPKLAAVAAAAGGMKVSVTTDLEPQRAAMLQLASAIDALVPLPPPPTP